MPFAKGKSGNPKGRPRGALSKAQLLLRELARTIVTDLEVQNRLLQQARAGTLHPAVMRELFHYHGGRPPIVIAAPPAPTRADELAEAFRKLPKAERLAMAEMSRRVRALMEEPKQVSGRVIDVSPARVEPAAG